MTSEWLITFLLFATVVLAVQGLYQYFGKDVPRKKQINRRLVLAEKTESRTAVLDEIRRERGIGSAFGEGRWFGRLVTQSGLRLRLRGVILGVLACTLPAALFLFLFSGSRVAALVIGPVIGAAMFLGFVGFKRRRRIAKFSEQLPDVLDIIVRSLKAGHPLPVSLGLVAREMADPAGSEFGMASDELAYGLDLKTVMENMAQRVGDIDLGFLVTAISIQSQTGGNLAEIIGRLSKLLRDRFKLRRKVHALTSEGRYSGMFLSVMPVLLFIVIRLLAPRYYMEISGEPQVPTLIFVSLSLLATGNLVMYKMVNFKY